MYLSRLILNPRSKAVHHDLADCHELHRTIMKLFPPVPAGVTGARDHFGVLYRLDVNPRGRRPLVLLVQSRVEPTWAQVELDYLVEDAGDLRNPDCKPVAEQYAAIRPGMALAFRLRANPTRKIDTKSGPDGQRRNGKRVELRGDEARINWLARKGKEEGGFELLHVAVNPDVPNVRAVDEDRLKGKRPNPTGGEVDRLTFVPVLFEGELRVTDADRFRLALENGIGPAKAFGFGLLSIARGERGSSRMGSTQ